MHDTIYRHNIKELTPPNETKTYKPVSHYEIQQMVFENIDKQSLMLRNEIYRKNKWGDVLVQVYQFDNRTNDFWGQQIAILNSYDKSRAVTIGIGANVYICMNGIVTGEYTYKRRHTGSVLSDTKSFIEKSFYRLQEEQRNIGNFIEKAQKIYISKREVFVVLGEMFIEDNIINTVELNKVKKSLLTGEYGFNSIEDKITVWDMYNHVTNALKDASAANYINKHTKLHRYIESLIEHVDL